MTRTTQYSQSKPLTSRRRRTTELSGAILACWTAAALVVASAAAMPRNTHAKTSLQQDANALVAAGVPGAILFARDGNHTVRLTAGVADLERRTAMDARDHYKIASITKTYTATVVLQLIAEGKLRLGD